MTVSLPTAARGNHIPISLLPVDDQGRLLPGYRAHPMCKISGKVNQIVRYATPLTETYHSFAIAGEKPPHSYTVLVSKKEAGEESVSHFRDGQSSSNEMRAQVEAVPMTIGLNLSASGADMERMSRESISRMQTNREVIEFFIKGGKNRTLRANTHAEIICYFRVLQEVENNRTTIEAQSLPVVESNRTEIEVQSLPVVENNETQTEAQSLPEVESNRIEIEVQSVPEVENSRSETDTQSVPEFENNESKTDAQTGPAESLRNRKINPKRGCC